MTIETRANKLVYDITLSIGAVLTEAEVQTLREHVRSALRAQHIDTVHQIGRAAQEELEKNSEKSPNELLTVRRCVC